MGITLFKEGGLEVTLEPQKNHRYFLLPSVSYFSTKISSSPWLV